MENEVIEIGSHTKAVMNIEDYAMTKENLLKQVHIIQDVMKSIMREGEHYGKAFPGAEKPSLLKSGAEKLNMTFRFAPKEKIERFDLPNGHREYEITCYLYSIVTGAYLGFGTGNCNTMETKYRYRDEERRCPNCGKETIIKGKEEYGGGWLCWTKRGGCGAKFKDDDPKIKDQIVGKVEYDNPMDYYNTIKKIAKKRALVDAVLTCTAASDIFTQDAEDLPEEVIPKPSSKKPAENGKKGSPIKDQGKGKGKDTPKEKIWTNKGEFIAEIKEFEYLLNGNQYQEIMKLHDVEPGTIGQLNKDQGLSLYKDLNKALDIQDCHITLK